MRLWGMAAVAALVLASFAAKSFAAENVAPTKAELEETYNAAYRAFDAKKFSEALKQLDVIDARQPDLAASKNLRGVILMRQGNYDQAEAAFQEAARIDPKFLNFMAPITPEFNTGNAPITFGDLQSGSAFIPSSVNFQAPSNSGEAGS